MKEVTFQETPPVTAPKDTIGEAWSNILHDPSLFIRHWNYKGAILSGLLRAPVFLITYLIGKESIKLALGAAFVQFIFRFLFAGLSGVLIQAFRRVEPAWKALATILLVIPLISHIFEFLIQFGFAYFTATNDHTDEAIIRSVCVSLISALFSLFIMRRDVLIVGEAGSKSLFSDLARLPMLIFDFIAFIPVEIARMLRRKEIIPAFFSILGFGVFAQILCWAIINKPSWTYGNGRSVPLLNLWGVDGIILMLLAIALSLIYLSRNDKKNLV
jgi:hypothetical protein